jgi:hypothetical protein
MTITTIDAINSLVPDFEGGVSTTANPDDGETIIWNNPKIAPVTLEEIEVEKTRLQAEYDAQEYARNRQAEYPDWGTQLEKIADDGIDAWKTDMLEPVKAKYPKPE